MHRRARSRHPPVGFPAPRGREPSVSVSNIDGRNSAPVSVKVRATERASMGTGNNRPFQTDALAVLKASAG